MTKIDKQIAEQLFDPKRKVSWRDFVKARMGPYMRKYGGHGPAIRQIAKEWKEYNKKRVMVKTKSKYKPKSKSKSGSWLDFVKSHKHLRTAKGLIDLKAISKLWKMKSKSKSYDPAPNAYPIRHDDKGNAYIWLQSVGYHYAIPVKDLKPGMIAVYNWGQTAEIVDIKPTKGKALVVVTKSKGIFKDELYESRKQPNTLIAVENKNLSDKVRIFDPGWNKGRKNTLWNRVTGYRRQEPIGGRMEIQDVRSHQRRTYDPPPKNWFYAMLQGIKKSSDVRNPGAIAGSIWRKLSPSKKSEIKARDAKGERFKYDLPLPDDRPTRGTGTLRMVKPFKLAEVQVNISAKDYIAALKSGLFSRMKRNDGTIALVARCKSKQKNCNIFVDKR